MAKPIMTIPLVATLMIGVGMGAFQFGKSNAGPGMVLSQELPMEQAIREVEVSIWETAHAIAFYMSDPQETALEEYRHQLEDVEKFMADYDALIETNPAKDMVVQLERMWAEVVKQADQLVHERNRMTVIQEEAWDAVHAANDVLHYEIEPALVSGLPKFYAKGVAVREVGVSLWEATNAVNYYVFRQFDKPQREFPNQMQQVEDYWNEYKNLLDPGAEVKSVQKFEELWDEAALSLEDNMRQADHLKAQLREFWQSVHQIDNLIDYSIQEYLKQRVAEIG